MVKNTKKILYRGLFIIGYTLLFASYIYAIYYSMPANDDFAWAIDWWSKNRLVEVFHRVNWNYNNFFGQSGVIAIIIQLLLNPLYWFDNKDHSFGVCMIIINALIMLGILNSVRILFKRIFDIENRYILDAVVFIVALVLTTGFYYSDVYNWWSGVPGYSGMMLCFLITCNSIVRYNYDAPSKRNYVVMIILGMLTCTSMMFCVPVGAFFVFYTFGVSGKKNNGEFFKKIFPLITYILVGISTVVAPGNIARMGNLEESNSIVQSMYVALIRTLTRIINVMQTKYWIDLLLIILVLLGLLYGSKRQLNIGLIVFGIICVVVSAFSGVLLYVHGSNKGIDSEFAPRIYYIEDYLIFIGFCLAAYAIGSYLQKSIGERINRNVLNVFALIVLLSTLVSMVAERTEIIQFDILDKREIINESWILWDEILTEIEKAPENSTIVIERANVTWCQYSYYVGLDNTIKEKLTEDDKYGNCNQCASKYYGVDSILVDLY